MSIEWNKGPKEAIGFAEGLKPGHNCIWYRRQPNGDLEYCNDDNHKVWMESFCIPDNVVWRESESSWPNSGLPQINTECEAKNPTTGNWNAVKILDHDDSDQCAVCREIGTDKLWWSDSFRPVRTQEEIAAEARDKAIAEMRAVVKTRLGDEVEANYSYTRDVLRALYDAEYRKQVQP